MSGAQGRRGEGISRRGELLPSKGDETKLSSSPRCLECIPQSYWWGDGVLQVGETQELDSGQCR